jgi:hypothetical protein
MNSKSWNSLHFLNDSFDDSKLNIIARLLTERIVN